MPAKTHPNPDLITYSSAVKLIEYLRKMNVEVKSVEEIEPGGGKINILDTENFQAPADDNPQHYIANIWGLDQDLAPIKKDFDDYRNIDPLLAWSRLIAKNPNADFYHVLTTLTGVTEALKGALVVPSFD
jgi:hypothetical protein